MPTLLLDLRSALRQVARNPGFSALVVLVLSLAIGGITAVFIGVNGLLLKPIAGARPQELVRIYDQTQLPAQSYRAFSHPKFVALSTEQRVFSGVAAFTFTTVGAQADDHTQRSFAVLASSNYFSVMEVPLALGRSFLPEEGRPDSSAAVVILSHEAWVRRGANPALVGQSLLINGRDFQVVGVLSASYVGFTNFMAPEYYFPLGMYDQLVGHQGLADATPLADARTEDLLLLARVRPGMTMAQAERGLQDLAQQLAKTFPVAGSSGPRLELGPQARFDIRVRPEEMIGIFTLTSITLMAFSLMVLVLACMNLTNMLLAKGAARGKEMAIRLALGGQRRQLIQQLLAEGLLLSLTGGVAGLLLGQWAVERLGRAMTERVGTLKFIPFLDHRVYGVTLGCCLLATLLFALGPAWKMSRPAMMAELKGQLGEVTPVRRRLAWLKPMNLMVVVQLAISLALLTGAGLMVRCAREAAKADLGFPLQGGLVAELDPSLIRYSPAQALQTYAKILDRLRARPGVAEASLAYAVPFPTINDGGSESYELLREDGTTIRNATGNHIADSYFRTLGVPLLQGREFTRSEVLHGSDPALAIIDQALAERLWPEGKALGRSLRFKTSNGPSAPLQVVGIVPTLKDSLVTETHPAHIYFPYGRDPQTGAHLHVRPVTPGLDLRPAVAACISAVDPKLPILSLRTLAAQRDANFLVSGSQALAAVFAVFGLLATFLAAVGLFGVRAQVVSLRTREFGIRLALGAAPRSLLGLVLREGLALSLVGLALGLLLSLGVSRLLQNLLYGVPALDPLTFCVAPAVLLGVALLGSLLPALLVTRIQPNEVMRAE